MTVCAHRTYWRIRRRLARALVAAAGVALAVALAGCEDDSRPTRQVVVFVLDTFGGGRSHGAEVCQIVGEASFQTCRIEQLAARTSEEFVESAGKILDFIGKHPGVPVVVNMSYGCYSPDPAEHQAIKALAGKGAVLVAAAGNDNRPVKMYPAGYEDVLAVAAVSLGKKADYSNYGPHVAVAVSGHLRSKRSVERRELHNEGTGWSEKTVYRTLIEAGTSFAAPRVAGAIAYLLHQRPDLTPQQVSQMVRETAAPLNDEPLYKSRQMGSGELDGREAFSRVDPAFRDVIWCKRLAIGLGILAILLPLAKAIWWGDGVAWALGLIAAIVLAPGLFLADLACIDKWGLMTGNLVSALLIFLTCLAVGCAFYVYHLMEERWTRRDAYRQAAAELVKAVAAEAARRAEPGDGPESTPSRKISLLIDALDRELGGRRRSGELGAGQGSAGKPDPSWQSLMANIERLIRRERGEQ